MRNSLTQIKTQKRGISYKTVSSPETNQLQKQVDNIYYQNNQLMVETEGETFPAVPQENLLPQVTTANSGQVATVDEDGNWTSQTLNIPTVGNGLIIIRQGGVPKGMFTVNQPATTTITLDGGGTTVVANPTLSGNEVELTGLEVAGTKYKVPSGGGGIVAVDSLPTASQTEYEKHLLYLQGGELNFIAEKVLANPTVDVVASLPSARYRTSAVAIDTNAYIFGGMSSSRLSDIVKFDSLSQTVTTLSATLPSARAYTSACAIGTNAYIFGGYGSSFLSDIVKFDSVSQTVTKLSVALPNARRSTSACAIGTNAYVFGGGDNNYLYLSDIVKFDSVSQTVTKLSVALPSARSGTSACAIGTDAYIFGGYSDSGSILSDIVKFDSVSQTVTKLSVALPSGIQSTSAVAIGTNAYIFGGSSESGMVADIVKFDSVSQTVTTLTATLPSVRYSTSAVAIGTNAYIFGGDDGSDISDIVQVAFATYVYKKITSSEV